MPFADYQSIADVARPFQIHFRRDNFITPLPVSLSEHFQVELDFTLREVPFDGSEAAACETLIYPFLREVWREYLDVLTLWSHQPLTYNTDRSGIPTIWWRGARR